MADISDPKGSLGLFDLLAEREGNRVGPILALDCFDECLCKMLRARSLPLGGKVWERAKKARELGLIDAQMEAVIDTLRKIRNKFTHERTETAITEDHVQRLVAHLEPLVYKEADASLDVIRKYADPCYRFIFFANIFYQRLAQIAAEEVKRATPSR